MESVKTNIDNNIKMQLSKWQIRLYSLSPCWFGHIVPAAEPGQYVYNANNLLRIITCTSILIIYLY